MLLTYCWNLKAFRADGYKNVWATNVLFSTYEQYPLDHTWQDVQSQDYGRRCTFEWSQVEDSCISQHTCTHE